MRVILCPHYDDGLLSLPDLLLVATQPPRLVVIFSEEDPALAAVCEAQYRRLGLPSQCLGLPEARRRGVEVRQILRSRRAVEDCSQDPLVEQVAVRLADLVPASAEILVPLCGVHLDHVLVRLAAERLCSQMVWPSLTFYLDEPYATVWPAAGERARQGLDPLGAEPAAACQAVESLLAPLAPFVGQRDLARLARGRAARNGAAPSLWRTPLDR